MTSFKKPKGRIMSWIIFSIVLLAAFSLLIVNQRIQEKNLKTSVQNETKEQVNIKKSKPFAEPLLSEAEKKEKDQMNLSSALESGAMNKCASIEFDETLKSQCEDQIRFTQILKSKNPEACTEIKNESLQQECQDTLYYELALASSKKNLCEKIQDQNKKIQCTDQLTLSSAKKNKGIEGCEKIKSIETKQKCMDHVYFADSIAKSTPSTCDAIQNQALKNNCKNSVKQNQEVIAEAQKTPIRLYQSADEKKGQCEKLEGASKQICSDEANFKLALEKQNLSYCQAIQNTQKQQECLQSQGTHLNHFYLKQALIKKDLKWCQKILNADLKSNCITQISN